MVTPETNVNVEMHADPEQLKQPVCATVDEVEKSAAQAAPLKRIAELPPQPKARPKLAAVILACNEDNILARCLGSLKDIAELHVSIDTATTDETEAVARRFTQSIYRHSLAESNSYSAARNGLQEAAEAATDAQWFLWIDPDEWLEPVDAQRLAAAVAEADERGAQAVMVTMSDLGDGATVQPTSWLNSKVFKRGLRFARRRHEHLTPTDLRRLEAPHVTIKHQKSQRPEVIAAGNKLKDNLQALVDDWQEFGDQRGAFYVGNAWAASARWHDAVSWYVKGLATCPDAVAGSRAQLLFGLARAYQHIGDAAKARESLFEFWADDWHNTPTALAELGSVAVNSKSLDEAALYFRLLNVVPPNVQSTVSVGTQNARELSIYGAATVSFARGQHAEALDFLVKATVLAGAERPQYADLRQRIVAALKQGETK
jgi:tetratricopeptide (TPR) repeat protein